MTMFRFCLRTPLIPFLFFLALIGCDQQNTAQEELKETRLEEIPSSHSLAKEFFSELGAFSTIGPKSVSKANMKRMTVARKNAETVTAVIAPLRSSTTSEISPIRVRKAGDESTYQISKARVLYIPSIGEFYRVDQHFTDPENKTGYLRFTKLGSKVPAVLKLKGGTVTQRIRMPRTKIVSLQNQTHLTGQPESVLKLPGMDARRMRNVPFCALSPLLNVRWLLLSRAPYQQIID